MSMIITYLAAPLSPLKGETLAGNLAEAKKHYAILSNRLRQRVFVADWILHCEVFAGDKDDDMSLRSLGMTRNFRLIEVCHELFLVGSRLSRGMQAEAEYAKTRGLGIQNLVGAIQ
jgi:hypothetical protein